MLISDYGRIVTGKTPTTKNKDYWDGTIPFVTPGDIQGTKHIFSTARNVSKSGMNSVRGAILPKGAICVSCIGNIGYVGMTIKECISNQQINSIIVNEKHNPDFVYYLMKFLWPFFKNYEGQSTTLSILNKGQFSKIEVENKSREEEDRIAAILSVIDAKIESNNEINKNLEQQAQAYFIDLFVENTDPDWPKGTLSDLGTVVGGGTPSKKHPEYYSEHGIPWIRPKDLSVDKSKFVSHGENDISELGFSNSSATKIPEGTVLFSSRAPIGYIAIASNTVTTNQGFKSVIPNNNVGTAFMYFFLKQALPTIEGMASGSTFKEISGSGMKSVPAVIPDNKTLCIFSEFCKPIFKQQAVVEAENRRLSGIRDALLPQLMSGELDVSDLDL